MKVFARLNDRAYPPHRPQNKSLFTRKGVVSIAYASAPNGRRLFASASLLILSACLGNGNGTGVTPIPPGHPSMGKIQHVVVVVQENRTFDNLFGGPHGFPGANTAAFGLSSSGQRIPLQSEPLNTSVGPDNSHTSWVKAYNGGQMNGFDQNPSGPYVSFEYVPRSYTEEYWEIAAKYAIADEMFGDNNGPTYVAHQYIMAGQSDNVAEDPNVPLGSPEGCDSPRGTTTIQLNAKGQEVTGPYPCFDYGSIGQELNNKGYEWRYYLPYLGDRIGGLNAYESIRKVFNTGPYYSGVITPAYVVNATGMSPYWSTTAILISWDDWGGFYDHVAPQERDFMGPSFRVPLMVVSPYSKRHYISHAVHHHGSILHFIERIFQLPSLGTTDRSSDDLADFFDLKAPPRPFESIDTSSCGQTRTHRAFLPSYRLKD
jgi:phospholipase C